MESFIAIAGWTQPHAPGSPRSSPFGHFRSRSSLPRSHTNPLSASRSGTRPPSVSNPPALNSVRPLLDGGLAKLPPHLAGSIGNDLDSIIPKATSMPTLAQSDGLTTLLDPRNRPSTTVAKPTDIDEVAAMSAKLINSINHQTNLDNSLSAARRDLDASSARIRELEEQVSHQREMLAGHVWVRRSAMELEQKALASRATDEKRMRLQAETEKTKIEMELESLSTALFEEAKNMVASAKEEAKVEQVALHRTIDQLKARVYEGESLLASQHLQLSELKQVMENLETERDDQLLPSAPTVHNSPLSSPTSPTFSLPRHNPFVKSARIVSGELTATLPDRGSHTLVVNQPAAEPSDVIAVSALAPSSTIRPHVPHDHELAKPTYPTSLIHILQPVLRTDLSAYEDFVNLSRQSTTRSGSRISSTSSAGLGGLGGAFGSFGIGLGSPLSSPPTSAPMPVSSNNSSLPVSPQPPSHSGTSMSNGGRATQPPGLSLRDTKFYKRALVEDIDPTLRLDLAPGLSWLARRAVLSSIVDGSLVVEPVLAPTSTACSLCPESRSDAAHSRTHRLRTNGSESAQCYYLCDYCLARVRSTCDYVAFLRLVRDGHWRVEDDDSSAWEESVRLREQMFWARIGGGVVLAAACSSAAAPLPPPPPPPTFSQSAPAPSPEPVELTPRPSVEGKGLEDDDAALDQHPIGPDNVNSCEPPASLHRSTTCLAPLPASTPA